MNVGEFSELFCKLKTLDTKSLIDPITNTSYKIDGLVEGNTFIFRDKSVIVTKNDTTETYIPYVELQAGLSAFTAIIKKKAKKKKKGEAEVLITDEELFPVKTLFNQLGIPFETAPNTIKADMIVRVEGKNENISIKSKVGSAPTLANASFHTNIDYTITGNTDTIKNAIALNYRPKDLVKYLYKNDCSLSLRSYCSDVFGQNLMKLNIDLPHVYSEIIIDYYSQKAKKASNKKAGIKGVSGNKIRNIVALDESRRSLIEEVSTAFALGMVPSDLYEKGVGETIDSFITLDSNFDLTYSKSDTYIDHVFDDMTFDTPSRTRHGFGLIQEYTPNNFTLKLNAQLRL